MTQINYIIFQLVRWNGTIATEELVFPLAIIPEMISYTYLQKTNAIQTFSSGNTINTHLDVFGRAGTKVQLRGVFGVQSRLSGLLWKNGWERLNEFKELLVKLSAQVPGQKKKNNSISTVLNSKRNVLNLFEDRTLKDNEVWAVNFYDFINSEKFQIVIENFNITEDAQRNNLPSYTINFTECGEPLFTVSSDLVLTGLLFAEDIFGKTLDKLNQYLGLIDKSSAINGIKKASQYKNLSLAALGIGTENNILEKYNSVAKNIFSGKSTKNIISGLKSIF